MAESWIKKSSEELEVTDTPDVIISIVSRQDVLDKIVEIQARISHHTASLVEAQSILTKWTNRLAMLDGS